MKAFVSAARTLLSTIDDGARDALLQTLTRRLFKDSIHLCMMKALPTVEASINCPSRYICGGVKYSGGNPRDRLTCNFLYFKTI